MKRRTRYVLGGSGAVLAVVIIASAATAGGHPAPKSVISAPASMASAVASAAPSWTCASGMSPDANGVCQPGGVTPTNLATTPAPVVTTPAMTVSEQQAVVAAQGYLSMGSGFSAYSLQKQLTSSYGDGFSQADAAFAIKYLHPDWYQQAVEAAKGYMQMGSGFSRDSLIQQLTSDYGDGFTYGQASYAATQVGL